MPLSPNDRINRAQMNVVTSASSLIDDEIMLSDIEQSEVRVTLNGLFLEELAIRTAIQIRYRKAGWKSVEFSGVNNNIVILSTQTE